MYNNNVPIKSRIEQLAEGYQEGFDQNLMKDQREKKILNLSKKC